MAELEAAAVEEAGSGPDLTPLLALPATRGDCLTEPHECAGFGPWTLVPMANPRCSTAAK